MGISIPQGLTPEQIKACDSFGMKVFGEPLFDHKPFHDGRHGLLCEPCRLELVRQAEERTKPAPAQPWQQNVVSLAEARELRRAA